MERQVLDEMAESRGPFALAGLWIRILVDLAVTVPSQLAREAATDARHAIRLWKRRLLHTGLAIGALAIGIGASTGVFSVVNALLLRALPFRDPDRLVATHIFSPPHESAQQFHDWRRQSAYLDDTAIFNHGDVNLGAAGEPARAHLCETSWNFFALLGTQPMSGRSFAAREDTPGNDGVAIIGYGLSQRVFGGSPGALGSTIRANGTALTIMRLATRGWRSHHRLWTVTTGFRRQPGRPRFDHSSQWNAAHHHRNRTAGFRLSGKKRALDAHRVRSGPYAQVGVYVGHDRTVEAGPHLGPSSPRVRGRGRPSLAQPP